MKPQKNFRTHKKNGTVLISLALLLVAISFTGCGEKKEKNVIIWTDNTAFVPYVELFNSTHDDVKALVIYKNNQNTLFSLEQSKEQPDIIIDSYLHSSEAEKYFQSLEFLFTDNLINPSIFYQQMLNLGSSKERQYLLPVCFNLPAVVFSAKNENLIENNYTLSLDQIQKAAGAFNKQDSNGLYTNMGFSPQWNPDFLYLCTKFKNVNFTGNDNLFTWDEKNLATTITFLRNWTKAQNTSPTAEQDFAFKYLYTPYYKQVTANHCLFSYTTSDQLFMLSPEDMNKIDYRWIMQDNKIPIEDSAVMMGIYKKSKNKENAETFILWFMKEKTQKQLLEHTAAMHLDTATFGIAGGFSGIKSVNEKVLPIYYQSLLANVPVASYISSSPHLPPKWESIKENIIIPYLKDSVNADDKTTVKSLDQRIAEWKKQHFQ